MKNFATALCLTGLAAAADQLTVGEYLPKTTEVDSKGYQWNISEGKEVLSFITDRRDKLEN